MAKWLVKSEPTVYGIEDLRREGTTYWEGVRNYQARNFLRSMAVGDEVLVYHSVTEPVGVVGLAVVASLAEADPSQFNRKSRYFEPNATTEKPRWFCPKLRFIKKFDETILLTELRQIKKLAKMELLRKGSRLSVQPVTEVEFNTIVKLKG